MYDIFFPVNSHLGYIYTCWLAVQICNISWLAVQLCPYTSKDLFTLAGLQFIRLVTDQLSHSNNTYIRDTFILVDWQFIYAISGDGQLNFVQMILGLFNTTCRWTSWQHGKHLWLDGKYFVERQLADSTSFHIIHFNLCCDLHEK